MGSKQSKLLKENKKFYSFWTKFLEAVDAINCNPKSMCLISLANEDIVFLTWDILNNKFPGCTYWSKGHQYLWSKEKIPPASIPESHLWNHPMQEHFPTFWQKNYLQVKDFYNGVN